MHPVYATQPKKTISSMAQSRQDHNGHIRPGQDGKLNFTPSARRCSIFFWLLLKQPYFVGQECHLTPLPCTSFSLTVGINSRHYFLAKLPEIFFCNKRPSTFSFILKILQAQNKTTTVTSALGRMVGYILRLQLGAGSFDPVWFFGMRQMPPPFAPVVFGTLIPRAVL